MELLKAREQERAALLTQVQQLNLRVEELEEAATDQVAALQEENRQLRERQLQDLEHKQLLELQISRLQTAQEASTDRHWQEVVRSLEADKQMLLSAKDALLEENQQLVQKVVECESARQSARTYLNVSVDGSSRSLFSPELSFCSQGDLSFFRQFQDSSALVNRHIGDYIQKLITKINLYAAKIKRLREQRDKVKVAYDRLKDEALAN